MEYALVFLLGIRPFINEQSVPAAGFLFNAFFCVFAAGLFLRRGASVAAPPAMLWLAAFLLTMLAASFSSVNLFNSHIRAGEFFVFFLAGLAVTALGGRARQRLYFVLTAGAMIMSLRALYQYFSGLAYLQNQAELDAAIQANFYAKELLRQHRAVSWFSGPNLLGSYLIMFFPLGLARVIEKARRKDRRRFGIALLGAAVLAAAVMSTKTMGALLAAGLSVILLAVFAAGQRRRFRLDARTWIMALLAAALIFAVFAGRKNEFIDFANPENSVVQRSFYWQSSWRMIREKPWRGSGPGNFGIVYPRFKHPRANETIYAHNSFLQLWAEAGAPAFVIFVIFLWRFFSSGVKNLKDLNGAGMLCGCAAFLLHNFVDYGLFVPQVNLVWICLAAPVMTRADVPPTRSTLKGKTAVSVLAALLAVNFYLFFRAEQSVMNAAKALQRKNYDRAAQFLDASLRFAPGNDYAYYLLARIYQEKGREYCAQTEAYFRAAIALNPEYAFYYYDFGKYLLRCGRIKPAKKFFYLALARYPTNKTFQNACLSISAP